MNQVYVYICVYSCTYCTARVTRLRHVQRSCFGEALTPVLTDGDAREHVVLFHGRELVLYERELAYVDKHVLHERELVRDV